MLVNCPECNHEVSDQAKVCPNCGAHIDGTVLRVRQNLEAGLSALVDKSDPEKSMRNVIICIFAYAVVILGGTALLIYFMDHPGTFHDLFPFF